MSIKKFFFKEEEPEVVAKVIATPTEHHHLPPPVIEASADYSNILNDVFEKRNIPGPDFLEFFKALKSLENTPMPEDQKYNACFVGLQMMGLTKEKVVSTSSSYIQAIEEESKTFNAHVEAVKKRDIADKISETENLAKENQDLQQKIQDNLNRINTLNSERLQSEANINLKTQQFTMAAAAAKQKIEEIVAKTSTYIKA